MEKELLEEAKKQVLLGDPDSAKKIYQKILKREAKNREALHGLSFIAFQRKDFAEAERYLLRAIQVEKGNPELHHSLGVCYLEQGAWEKAVHSFNNAKKIFEKSKKYASDQRYFNTLSRLASLYIQQQSFLEAKLILRKLLRKQPENIDALKMYAQVCMGTRAFAQASTAIEKMGIDPAVMLALLVEVNLLKEDFPKALELAEKCLRLNASEPHFYFLKGECLLKNQKLEESIQVFNKGLDLDPFHPQMLVRLLTVKIRICDWGGREEIVERIRKIKDAPVPPTIGILAGFNNAELRAFAESSCRILEKVAEPVRERLHFSFSKRKRKKIRIGYLSSDFHDHATAHLMADLFALHDRKKFEVYAYSYGKNDKSYYRKRIQKDCDRFIEIKKMSDTQAAQKIYKDQIDILVDLKGHIVDHRLGILALRPAPVQVHYLGYPGTIGAGFIDYLIADTFVIPKSERKYYTESLIYMPHTYQVNMRSKEVLKASLNRKEYGIPQDSFVFCCFNQNDKFDPVSVRTWMEILQKTPHSVLWVWGNYPKVKERFTVLGKEYGIAQKRIIVSPTEPSPKHLARMKLADLFLDTFLYNAHTSCSDAIRIGLPVLTCPGSTFASRVAGDLLKTVKGEALIVKTREEYIDKAIAFAENPKQLFFIKEKLLKHRENSPLFQPELFAKSMDKAFQQIWERHTRKQKLADLYL